ERKTPVHLAADHHGIAVRTPQTLKSADAQDDFASLQVDAAVVVAYGLILPRHILDAPRHGCFNLHASLLPRWRGAAPIQRAIMSGDKETGVCVMQMDEGLDTGDVCLCERLPIAEGMTAGELHDQLAARGAPLMVEALAQLDAGTLSCTSQPQAGVIYAAKIDKAEARIDFAGSAGQVLNHIHGLSPFPGAWFEAEGESGPVRIKVLKAEPADAKGPAGHIHDDQLTITCGTGAIRPIMLQRAGKGAMDRLAFLRGYPVAAGARLDLA
ncbi:MAG: methionyl-tRNA formyltransferase, partial [Rhizobiales bacterium]|nr:methionyl-tRNA formyltransferase [Hyphomicrobiales bacterium]